jgi:hypothetical protein
MRLWPQPKTTVLGSMRDLRCFKSDSSETRGVEVA